MFGFGGKKCPGCSMKVEKGTGFEKNGQVFCSEDCAIQFEKGSNSEKKQKRGCGCC